MACLGFVTFFPLRPLFNLPSCISCISLLTCLPDAGLYLRVDFFAADFFAADFFAGVFFAGVFFVADFFVAFLVAMWVKPPVQFERKRENYVASGVVSFSAKEQEAKQQTDAECDVKPFAAA